VEANFGDKLVPIVHGADMDVFPENIPPKNIARAAKVLSRWRAARPESDRQVFEGAWLDFLHEDYGQAAQKYSRLARKVEEGKILDPYLRFDSYLNLGRCYDLLGERKKALDCYARGEELIVGTRWERAKTYIFQDYDKVPYKRIKSKSEIYDFTAQKI
jgi:tetratricopeptide (TPR) repeat protein